MKRFLKITISLIAGLIIAAAMVIPHFVTREFASPRRRPLQDYHIEYLNNPLEHGISISRLDETIPCLVIEPVSGAKPAKRGRLMREQLAARNVSLSKYGKVEALLVILHGRSGRKEDLLPVAERFCAAGFRCLVPDLPGHGENPETFTRFGSKTEEASLVRQLVEKDSASEGLPRAILGISMGGSFAVKTAQQTDDWYGMVIVSSFDSLDRIVGQQCQSRAGFFGSFLSAAVTRNARKMAGLDIPSVRPVDWAKTVSIPVLVAHGTRDRLIPPGHGRSLFEAFQSREKRWVEVPGGDHNNVLTTPMQLYATMGEWLIRHRPGG